MPLPTRILVATDFSDGAAVAQEYASALALALGARLHVLHVIRDRPLGDALGAGDLPELVERTEREVWRRLEGWSATDERRGLDVAAAVAIGVPDAAIRDYADTHAIDLIVIGGCGHGGEDPPRLGHVAVRVLQSARCPVLAVTHGAAAAPAGARQRARAADDGRTPGGGLQ